MPWKHTNSLYPIFGSEDSDHVIVPRFDEVHGAHWLFVTAALGRRTLCSEDEMRLDRTVEASGIVLGVLVCADARAEQLPSAPERNDPHHLRATLEMAAGLGAGTLWYVIDDRNVLDWDNPAIEQRFNGEAWRFDNNGFNMNFVLHPLTGAGTHVLARGNHIDFWPSTAYTLGVSFFWEYVIEFKEKVSVNDVLVTTGGGVPIGEFFHKFGTYLHSAEEPGVGLSALQWSLGTSVAMHRAMDGPVSPPKSRDSFGLDADIWHGFELSYAPTWVSSPNESTFVMHETRARGELVSIPGYGRVGRLSRWFHEGELSRLDLAVQGSGQGAGVHIDSDLVLAGYHNQALRVGPAGGMEGHATTAGLALSFRFRNTDAAGFDDRQGILRMPGPLVRSWVGTDNVSASLHAQAHASFGGLSSLSFPAWRRAHPDSRTKAIAAREGYFYGWGWSTTVAGTLQVGPLELQGSFRLDELDSQENLDRAQEIVEADVDLDESLATSRLEASFGGSVYAAGTRVLLGAYAPHVVYWQAARGPAP